MDKHTDDVAWTPEMETAMENGWRSRLLFKDIDGDIPIKQSQHNANVLCAEHPAMKGALAFDLFTNTEKLMRAPPWDTDGVFPRETTDVDATGATAWMETLGVYVGSATTCNAMLCAAHANSFDPLVDYLSNLKWDGCSRLTVWMEVYMGVLPCEYSQAISRAMLIGAVARALRPGCKLDTMVIFEGKQGRQKSTAVRALFGKDWFTDEVSSIGSKDAAMQLHGKWGVEIAEMGAMNRAETNAIKEWTSREKDIFRPPYGRKVETFPRRSILIGTLNPDGNGYLKDYTGGRRFWPVACGDIDVPAIKRDRDQLWAEAVHYYCRGEQWWLTKEMEVLAGEEQSERVTSDPWEEAIEGYLVGRDWVLVSDILSHALDLSYKDQTMANSVRVGKYLTKLGWESRRRTVNGKQNRCRVRPGKQIRLL